MVSRAPTLACLILFGPQNDSYYRRSEKLPKIYQ